MATYVPIQSLTLTSNTTTVTFSNIDQSYTDLRLVMTPASSSGTNGIRIRVGNGGVIDAGSNYSYTAMDGNGSTSGSYRESGVANATLGYRMAIQTGFTQTYTVDFLNYSNTTTFKTVLFRYNDASVAAGSGVFTWRSTAAMNTFSLNINTFGSSTGDFISGSTFDLYGISPVNAKNTAAYGGTSIYYDSNYVYHVFNGSGSFVPVRNLTCDYLVIAGGGGAGSYSAGGGGGAGGLRSTVGATGGNGALESALSLVAGTSYTITVGAGGSGSINTTAAVSGTSSSISGGAITTVTSVGGGYGGGYIGSHYAPASGGSGGGGNYNSGTSTGASGTANQGYAGGSGFAPSVSSGGGGGGAGGAGGNGSSSGGGNGGNGVSIPGFATATGTGVSNYYAGGGGGETYDGATQGTGGLGGGGNAALTRTNYGFSGVTNTGGGGGAAATTSAPPTDARGGNGGSGLVILRYAR